MKTINTNLNFGYYQSKYLLDNNRFKALYCGRRGTKTFTSTAESVKKSIEKKDSNVIILEPSYQMVKRIIVPIIQQIGHGIFDYSVSDNLFYNKYSKGRLYLGGSWNLDSFRGVGYDHAFIDEAQDQSPEVYYDVIRPALADRKGSCSIAGTPKGRGNWFTDIILSQQFSVHTWTTLQGGYVDPEEIEDAKHHLDERTFRQEFEASIEDNGSMAYYKFSENNITDCSFDPKLETYLCWDFNVNERPMSCIVVQKKFGIYYAVKEFIHKFSNTEGTCNAVLKWLLESKYANIQPLYITGDHAGTHASTKSAVDINDYMIIANILRRYNCYDWRKTTCPTLSIRDRVNGMNALLCNTLGEIRFYIDRHCLKTIEDFWKTIYLPNGTELDGREKERTHATDAVSYLPQNFENIKQKVKLIA